MCLAATTGTGADWFDWQHVDTDIPTQWEAKMTSNPLGKFVWLFFQIFAYALRYAGQERSNRSVIPLSARLQALLPQA